MHAIVPTAGLATRMRGLPKFLLPCDDEYLTLIERHVLGLLEVCDVVWIPTTYLNSQLIQGLGLDPRRVVALPMSTKTMSESVLRVASLSSSDRFIMAMPDTYFFGEQPYTYLSAAESDLALACWKIRPEQKGKLGQVQFGDSEQSKVSDSKDKEVECDYDFFWGAMQFNRAFIGVANPEVAYSGIWINPAISKGLLVEGKVMEGQYFDCGTVNEYFSLLDTLREAGAARDSSDF